LAGYAKTPNNWQSVPVVALDDDNFWIVGGREEWKVFRDEDLKPDEEGKVIINIEYLDLKFFTRMLTFRKSLKCPRISWQQEKKSVN
jgi:hypothetical protein